MGRPTTYTNPICFSMCTLEYRKYGREMSYVPTATAMTMKACKRIRTDEQVTGFERCHKAEIYGI